MQFTRIMLLSAMMAGAAAAVGAADRFFAGIEDLPVMAGLREIPGAGISFDKPQGRIVVVAASGKVSKPDVIEFYAAVLPQLGWRRSGDGGYRREGERLNLSIVRSGQTLTVRFSLRPE